MEIHGARELALLRLTLLHVAHALGGAGAPPELTDIAPWAMPDDDLSPDWEAQLMTEIEEEKSG